MLMRKTTLALLVATFTTAVVGLGLGCGGGTSRPKTDGGAGSGGGGEGGGQAGSTAGVGGSTAGSGGAAGMDAGAGTSGGGAGGMDAAAGSDGGGQMDAPPDLPPVKPDGSMGISDTFDTTIEAWYFTKYGSTPDANAPNNLALISTGPVWDGTDDADGKTTSGSLKGTVPFTAAGDRIDFQAFSVAPGMYDWTGYTVSAKVKLVSGGNIAPGCPLTAWLYVSGPAPGYMSPTEAPVNLTTGSWVTLTFNMTDAAAGGADITHISQMGIQITTGATCVGTAPDGGTDGSVDMSISDGASESSEGGTTPDGGVSEAGTDGGSSSADGGVSEGGSSEGGTPDGGVSDGGDGPPVAPTATTAVILIDDVIVSVSP